MALPTEFSLLHSELNDFLFAPLGEGENGVPLSVLSALTRLDLDPWAEATRLATMPRDAAVDALVTLIGRFPRKHQTMAEIRAIAGRLAPLLPIRPSWTPPTAAPSAGRRQRSFWLTSLVLVLVLVLAAIALRDVLPWP